MIYVVASSAFKDNSLSEHMNLIKIGYTDDSIKKLRYSQYKLHNPSVIVLYEILDCDVEIEDRLHQFFLKFRYDKYGREWYYWNEEIIQFFETNKTKEDLEKALPPKKEELFVVKERKYCYQLIDTCLKYKIKHGELDYFALIKNNEKDQCYEQLLLSGFYEKSEIKNYILSYFNISSSDFDLFVESFTNSPEILKFINDFNNVSHFTNKMKLLCTTKLNEEDLNIILLQIPIDYFTIYNTLSLDKIKALCYKRGELMKECNKVLSDSKITSGDIKSEFAKVFIVGEKYTIANVKNLVREVYDNLGLNKSPKAVDILDYFEVLKTKAKNETGEKFVDAYKILKLKE